MCDMINVETTLEQQLYDGQISRLDYTLLSPEHREAFQQFCQENYLLTDEKAAEKYIHWLLDQELKAHTECLD